MVEHVQTTRLPNGLTLISEFMPGLRSATVGIWVRRGSRHEAAELNGICHFIEHVVFKGTIRRSALDIAIEADRLGGQIDAFTSQELTGFTMRVADSSVAQAFDLLSDMIARPRLAGIDLEREQRVIIEEMKMVEDTPDEYLAELFNAAYFPGHSLGRPIEGTEQTVSSFDHEKTANFHAKEYGPHNLVIAAAGNVSHEQLRDMAAEAFTSRKIEGDHQDGFQERPTPAAPILIEQKSELEQAHLLLAAPWPDACSKERYACSMLSSIIGGSTSSRLWQSIREERGLAYAVGAGASTFLDTGIFTMYAGTSPEHVGEVVDLAIGELRNIVKNGVAEDELRLVKDQAISSILLGLESSSVRAGVLARQEIVHGRYISPDEIIRDIQRVSVEQVQSIAQTYFKTEALALAALGDLNGFLIDRSRLEI